MTQEKTVSISGALRTGWREFKKHGWFLVGAFLASIMASLIIGSVSDSRNVGIEIIGNLASAGISILISIAWTTIALKAARGQEVVWKDLVSNYKLFWKYTGASILYALIVMGGLILLIIPGIIWALKYKMFSYLIIDKNMGIMEAFRESARLTKGNRWSLLGFIIVGGLINIAGLLVIGIGFLITAPIIMIATAQVYLYLAKDTKKVEAELVTEA